MPPPPQRRFPLPPPPGPPPAPPPLPPPKWPHPSVRSAPSRLALSKTMPWQSIFKAFTFRGRRLRLLIFQGLVAGLLFLLTYHSRLCSSFFHTSGFLFWTLTFKIQNVYCRRQVVLQSRGESFWFFVFSLALPPNVCMKRCQRETVTCLEDEARCWQKFRRDTRPDTARENSKRVYDYLRIMSPSAFLLSIGARGPAQASKLEWRMLQMKQECGWEFRESRAPVARSTMFSRD